MSQWAKYSAPDPELAPLLAKVPKMSFSDPLEIREKLNTMFLTIREATKHDLPVGPYYCRRALVLRTPAHCPHSESEYRLENRKVPVEGGEIIVRVLTPTTSSDGDTFPVLVWYHGGGERRH